MQPSRRPADGRYGENPNRLQHYYQYQVILKPNPPDLQALVTYHLINARLDSAQIKGHAATPVPTVANAPVTLDGSGPALKANDADIVQADVLASNGVIQVVDKVLSPGWSAPPPGTAAPAAGG